jgi:2-polyprenyl-3-methyl-5-hydroxy-6-metoxy-1,4-benzoquinol methylase
VSTAAAAEQASCPIAKAVVTERQQREVEAHFDYGVVSSSGGANKVFVHGNYHRYYGYRLGKAFEEDPRLGLMEKQWFHKKRCLDIGCNEGIVTLSIAKTFGTKSMTGIDLDEHLIKRACSYVILQNTFVCIRRKSHCLNFAIGCLLQRINDIVSYIIAADI